MTAASDSQCDQVPLVLLPGTLCDARLFAPMLAALPARRAQVGDLTGLTSAAALAERLLAQAPPRFALLGFSLGAIVALEMAVRAPGRLAGLALVGGNAHDLPSAERAQRRATARKIVSARTHVAEHLWPTYVADPADTVLADVVLAMSDAFSADALAAQTEVALERTDSRPRLGTLAMPTLVLAGEADAINPPPVQRAMADALPNATLILVPAAGHFVLLERPDACAHAVADWLARTDARDRPEVRTACHCLEEIP